MCTGMSFFTLLKPYFKNGALFFQISACEESSLQVKDAKNYHK